MQQSGGMNKTLIEIAAGVAGGVLGTMLMQRALRLQGKLPPSLRGPEVKEDPGQFLVNHGSRATGTYLSPDARRKAATALQFIYGITGPLVLGAAARRLGKGS